MRRPTVPVASAVVAVVAAGVLVAAVALSGDEEPADATVESLTTAEATRRDLVEYVELSGSMGFADTDPVAAATAGTVTALGREGAELGRGDTVLAVDTRPVVVFYGTDPLYRPLGDGDEGDDVVVLEQNLASLGHHTVLDADGAAIDTGFVVDGVFDGATADAVTRWQESLGVEGTGRVEPGAVVVAPGPVVVTSVAAEVGDRVQPGVPLLVIGAGPTVRSGHAEPDRDLVAVAAPGEVVAAGSVIATDGGSPVIAVIADPDEVGFDRDLGPGVAPGPDVRAVEQTLVDAGFDAAGAVTVDDTFDDATAAALDELWAALGAVGDAGPPPGSLPLDSFVAIEPGAVVAGPAVPLTPAVPGSELWTTTSGATARTVTTAIEVADRSSLTEGDEVTVELPDGSSVVGTVTRVALSSVTDPARPDVGPLLPVTITVDDVPEAMAGYAELDVTVLVVDRLAADAVVVPVTALVPTGDGGYAVEVVDRPDRAGTADGDETRFVAVEPGLFADGAVEVTGIDAGVAVVVPR